jgi:hypothetical protein
MPFSEIPQGAVTIGATEWSLATNTSYDSGDAQATEGGLYVRIDVTAMAAGDTYRIRIYEKVISGGTQRAMLTATLVGAQSDPIWVSPGVPVKHGWDVTIKKIAGTDRAFDWSILRAPA